MVRYGRYVKYLLCGTVFSCTLEVQEVRSVEVFTIKFHPSAYFALLDKIDSPFCLQNCLFLWLPILLNFCWKFFCQGLYRTVPFSPKIVPANIKIYRTFSNE